MRNARPTLPLWAWATGGAFSAAMLLTGAFTLGLAISGQLNGADATTCVSIGAAAAVLVAGGAGFGAHKMAEALLQLRDDALRRLRDPEAVQVSHVARGVGSSAELTELSSAVEALALRMRVADDLALRHRLNAETASAGMFELLSGLIAAEEGARGQLAAELHDTVAQSLVVARALLADDDLERAAEAVADAEDQLRATMARTRPPALQEGDLGAAVGLLRDDLARRYALSVAVRWPDDPQPLPLATAITVYRFFQEALLNVVKHADVDDAALSLLTGDGVLTATVSDAGGGFVLAEVRPDHGRHVGLGLLRERVRLAGGTLEVDARPGEGTALTLRLPLGARMVEPNDHDTDTDNGTDHAISDAISDTDAGNDPSRLLGRAQGIGTGPSSRPPAPVPAPASVLAPAASATSPVAAEEPVTVGGLSMVTRSADRAGAARR